MAIAKYATSYLSPLGRFDEAAEGAELALDPLSPYIRTGFAINFGFRRLYDRLEQEPDRVLEKDPATVRLHWFLGRSRSVRGNWSGALDAI
jgi:hypothetical protein